MLNKLFLGRNIFGYLFKIGGDVRIDDDKPRVDVRLIYDLESEESNIKKSMDNLRDDGVKPISCFHTSDTRYVKYNDKMGRPNGRGSNCRFAKITFFPEEKLLNYLNELTTSCREFLDSLFNQTVKVSLDCYLDDRSTYTYDRFIFAIDDLNKIKNFEKEKEKMQAVCDLLQKHFRVESEFLKFNSELSLQLYIKAEAMQKLVNFYKCTIAEVGIPSEKKPINWSSLNKKIASHAFFPPAETPTSNNSSITFNSTKYNEIVAEIDKIKNQSKTSCLVM